MTDIYALIKKEGWEIIKGEGGEESILAYGETFKLSHPMNIHRKLYRTEKNPERKFFHMKRYHDYLFPEDILSWNYWTERRFKAHCGIGNPGGRWNYISMAAGANMAKSYDAAKIALLFYLANPKERGVVIASTTLSSLDSRIWGYVKKFYVKVAKTFPMPLTFLSHPNPRILYDKKKAGEPPSPEDKMKDTLHGMFAVAATRGDDEDAIKNWIGRHPDDELLVILDEGTDMPLAITTAFPNLEAKPQKFQCMIIGNSQDKFDLHGTMSTPKVGWNNIDHTKQFEWETTLRNGVCLYFYPYDSPAIWETDPEKKKRLSEFLITKEELDIKEQDLGKDTKSFWRFVLGFWMRTSGGEYVIAVDYIDRYEAKKSAEWSGVYPIRIPWGLDPSFSSQGDNCYLRFAFLGVDTRGKMVLDFRGLRMLHKIDLLANTSEALDIQIVKKMLPILKEYGVTLGTGCIDANGTGYGLAETAKLYGVQTGFCTPESNAPTKVITTRLGAGNNLKQLNQHGVLVKNSYDLLFPFRAFMENGQIRGLDDQTIIQITNRLIVVDKKGRPSVEPKSEYKKRMGSVFRSQARSPDELDAAALVLQSAILNYGFYPGQEMKLENSFVLEKVYQQHRATQATPQVSAKTAPIELQANFTSSVEDLPPRGFS